MGIVSVLGKPWRIPAGGAVDRYLQVDTVMYPGFFEGPLVDARGRFVGLNNSALLRGVSITVPAPTLSRVVGELLEHGSVRRAYLGVGAQPTRLPDTLVSLGESPVRQMDGLFNGLDSERICRHLAVRIIKGGQLVELTVSPTLHP